MGYYSNFTGELTFSRPLTYFEISVVPKDPYGLFGLEVIKEQQIVDEGILTKHRAIGIEVIHGDECKGYDAQDNLQKMINALPDDVEVTGQIKIEGEDAGDIHRYVVEGRQVVDERARLIWPDGSAQATR